jgi:hypothetical protein
MVENSKAFGGTEVNVDWFLSSEIYHLPCLTALLQDY